jgi:hypothetical protein
MIVFAMFMVECCHWFCSVTCVACVFALSDLVLAQARKAKTAKSTKAATSLKLQALKQTQSKPVANAKPKAGAQGRTLINWCAVFVLQTSTKL